MDKPPFLAALKRYWEYAATDQDIAHEMYHDDAVLEFPQSQDKIYEIACYISDKCPLQTFMLHVMIPVKMSPMRLNPLSKVVLWLQLEFFANTTRSHFVRSLTI